MSSDRSQPTRSANDEALRLLARRPHSVAELREALEQKGHPRSDIDAVCSRLREAGYLDDRRLATEFIATRSERLRHGPRKLVEALCRRGVDREVAESAMRRAIDEGDVDPRRILRGRIERQVAQVGSRLDPRAYARVYNALRRAGFDAASIREELEPWRAPGSHEDPITDESTDDFA